MWGYRLLSLYTLVGLVSAAGPLLYIKIVVGKVNIARCSMSSPTVTMCVYVCHNLAKKNIFCTSFLGVQMRYKFK